MRPEGVLIVVLNWNQPEMTGRCLAHLEAQAGPPAEVVVFDNGSGTENRRRLAEVCAGRVRVVWLPRNRGFAGGMNAGLRHAARAGASYVWLLNNDAFPEPDCLRRLVAALDADPTLGMVTPRLHGEDGGEQHAGARVDWATADNHVLFAADLARPVSPGGGVWLTGTALLCRVAAVAAAGGFDPAFFAYWEETDLCVRVGRLGYRVRAVPDARCLHLGKVSTGGAGSPFAEHLMARNRCRFFRKHTPAAGLVPVLLRQAAASLGRIDAFPGRPDAARAIVGGVWSAALGRAGRPARLTAPGWVEGVVLRHRRRVIRLSCGLARRFDRLVAAVGGAGPQGGAGP